jgi:hypothetical protein
MPLPTYQELNKQIDELTGLLRFACISICSLQAQLARVEGAEEYRDANKAAMRRIRQIGLWAYMVEIEEAVKARPEHPLVAAAVRRAELRMEGAADLDALTWNCPHIAYDGWGCGAAAGKPCDWSHDARPEPGEERPAFHAERLLMAAGDGSIVVPTAIVDRAADDLVG